MKKYIKSVFQVILISAVLLVVVDQLLVVFKPSVLYPSHYDIASYHRSPKPYIEFAGLPNVLDHNELGYRWTIEEKTDASFFKIAFFGGSTGYDGEPPIATLLENLMRLEFGKKIKVANFSVVSSNHRQHIHNIIESNKDFIPDLVIFYGGYNETAQTAFYDPRPGYPYNFFYRAETDALRKVLLERSPTINLLNRIGIKFNLFDLTPQSRLRDNLSVYSESWKADIHNNYFETLSYANSLSNAFASTNCSSRAKFRAFYQPYQIPENLKSLDAEIRKTLKTQFYIYDVSDVYRGNEHVFTDIVHVTQEGNELMAQKLFALLKNDQSIAACIRRELK